MALMNTLEPQVIADCLAEWLPHVLGADGPVKLSDLEIPTASGMSSETILFTATWQEGGEHQTRGLVIRRPPNSQGLFVDYDIAREGRVMSAMAAHSRIAVPEVIASELTGKVLGVPFLLLDRVYGTVPGDDPPFVTGGWVLDLSSEQRARMFDNALRTIAEIQRVDPFSAGLSDLGYPDLGTTVLDQQIEYWKRFYAWAANGRTSPTIDAAFEILVRTKPTVDGPVVVTWGDARLGNLMFGPDQSVTGVFDWEMATLGVPEVDLGYFLFFHRMYSSGLGLPRLDGFPDHASVIARFEELSGRRVTEIDWFEAWGALRGAILLVRVGNLMIELGMLPADADMPFNNPAAQVLASLLDISVPSGSVGWISGNR
ncbi:phosphotransferase family protein (plasmid) [Rhodococcus rhodochrous]|uniref:phosphotransferase family protein n=1 Tax=Rhodococcus rhodochrous TaxID=1829 RepID=UPI00132F16F0|nr:phosphotransferase family protein [Rhodococcus rhodochrous]QHG85538.1 phosphotransferase family protein [Rhodococcus rhodochrous]